MREDLSCLAFVVECDSGPPCWQVGAKLQGFDYGLEDFFFSWHCPRLHELDASMGWWWEIILLQSSTQAMRYSRRSGVGVLPTVT